MVDEKLTPPMAEGGDLPAGENPGSSHTQAAHDYHPPHGADAVEPDHPPMRLLTITIVVLGIVVIGTGIALGEWLSLAAQAEMERKQGDPEKTEIVQLRRASEETLASFGYDEEKKLHRIPIQQAMDFLAKNPERVSTPRLWSELKPLDTPEAPGGAQGQPAPEQAN